MSRKSLLGVGIAASLLLFVALASAEVVQQHGIRASFQGTLTPKRLPLHGSAPVKVSLSAKISGSAGSPPPLLRRIAIAINRHGHFEPAGLPVCRLAQIQPTTNVDALRACGRSLVGEGQFSAQVGFTGQAPFPARGKVLAFNGIYKGAPAILAHVYGTHPAPTSALCRSSSGRGMASSAPSSKRNCRMRRAPPDTSPASPSRWVVRLVRGVPGVHT